MSRSGVQQRKFVRALTVAASAGLASLAGSAAYAQTVGDWIGPTSTGWADPAHWQGGLVPNGQGHTAQYGTTASSQITLQDVPNPGGVTVGTLKVYGTNGGASWQINPTNNVYLNQDGTGPLPASVINDIQSATPGGNASIFLNPNAGGAFVLQDDTLFVSNTSNSARGTGSIRMIGTLVGTLASHTINVENVNNSTTQGAIQFGLNQSSAFGGFGGNVNIRKGAVNYSRGDTFTPSPGNIVTLGAAGMGDVNFAFIGSALGNMENGFVVAADTGGTTVWASAPTGAAGSNNVTIKTTNTNAASIRLDGNVSFDNRVASSTFSIGDVVHGIGRITAIGAGPMRVTNTNSYQGGTVVNAGSLLVAFAPDAPSPFGFHAATNGTLGSGDVTVASTATQLEIEGTLSAVNVIADTAALTLGGGGAGGRALLNAGINETIGGLVLGGFAQSANGTYGSTASGATFQNDTYFSGSGVVTLALGRTLYWDVNGDTAGAGGDTPAGTWGGDRVVFNTNSAGGAGGTLSYNSIATDPVVFTAGTDGNGAYTVNVSGTQNAASVRVDRGDVTFAGTGTIATPSIEVAAGAAATLGVPVDNTVGVAVTINAGATLRSQAGQLTALDVNTLTVAATGRVDVNDGGIRKRNGGSGAAGQTATQQITALLKTGLENGGAFDWQGPGISSTEAFNDNTTAGSVLYGVGVLQNNLAVAGSPDGTTTDETSFNEIYTSFKGRTVALNDTLVRYTYMGDADLSGDVTSTDYSLIDSGFALALSGWVNGDFDYSGTVDATDYALIDNAFAFQTGVLPEQVAAMYAQHAALFGQEYIDAFAAVQSGVVPEPGTLGVLALAGVGLMARRRRA